MSIKLKKLKSSRSADNTFLFNKGCGEGDVARRLAERLNREAARDLADGLLSYLSDGNVHRVRVVEDVHTDNGGLKCTATWTAYIETDYQETGAGVVK